MVDAVKEDNDYICSECGAAYGTLEEADKCCFAEQEEEE